MLRRPGFDSQLEIVTVRGEECLKYTEDLSTKTNQGGLKHEQLYAKQSMAYPAKDSNRCLVNLFKKYCEMLPKEGKTSAFYLQQNTKKKLRKGGA